MLDEYADPDILRNEYVEKKPSMNVLGYYGSCPGCKGQNYLLH